tara:strand:+ start:421 stop:837 length:417 start_codon:yes stop_codon:yes gene_type:complete
MDLIQKTTQLLENDASGKKSLTPKQIVETFIQLRDANLKIQSNKAVFDKMTKSVLEQEPNNRFELEYISNKTQLTRIVSLEVRKASIKTVKQVLDGLQTGLYRPSKAKNSILVTAYDDNNHEVQYITKVGSQFIKVSD